MNLQKLFNKLISFIVFLFFLLLNSQPVIAGNPPSPTSEYIAYMNNARVLILYITMPLVFVLNIKLYSVLFKRFKLKVKKDKIFLLGFLATTLSFLLYNRMYQLGLPNADTYGMFGKNIFASFVQIVTAIIYTIFHPINWLFLCVYYLISILFLKNITETINNKKIIAFFMSVIMLPIFGILISGLLFYCYTHTFPFVGNIN